MNDKVIQLNIVSLEDSIFSGEVNAVIATGHQGELGIYPHHTPLLTTLRPGPVRALLPGSQAEEIFYISGGLLEVQPSIVTILADTGMRAEDIDEAAALEAKKRAEEMLEDRQSEFDYSLAAKELAQAAAQLRILKNIRRTQK
jgi:F-type H+-transporting ATPase subunit epsilon